MVGMVVLLTAAAVGVDYGWQPVAGGGFEYIIQIQPQALEQMLASYKAGQEYDIQSDIPPAFRGMRSYRITVGVGELPHHNEDPPMSLASLPARPAPTSQNIPRYPLEMPAANAAAPPAAPRLEGPQLTMPANGATTSTNDRFAAAHAPPATGLMDGNHAPVKSIFDRDKAPMAKRAGAGISSTSVQGSTIANEGSPSDNLPNGYSPAGQTDARPWWPLYAALIGLFTSMGGNVFLSWVNWGQRERYRTLLWQVNNGRA